MGVVSVECCESQSGMEAGGGGIWEEFLMAGDLEKAVGYLEVMSADVLTQKLANHTIQGLPTLHYLAWIRFSKNAKAHLDKLIKVFVHAGYDIDKRTNLYKAKKRKSLGFTALLAAIEKANVDLVESLLRHGARVDIRDENGFSPCHWAILVGDLRCLDTLIENGAPVASTEQERKGEGDVHPIMHTAVDEGRTEMVFFMINNGLVDVNEAAVYRGVLTERAFTEFPSRYNNESKSLETVDKSFTPLERAVRMRKIPIIEILLASKEVNLSGFSELHFCIVEGDTEVACLLKGYFSDEDLSNDKIWNQWALHCLHPLAFQEELRVEKTKEIIVEYIIANWDVNSVSGSANNPRAFTITCGKCRWCADVIFPVSYALTDYNLLHIACIFRGSEIIKCLVEEGAHINQRTGGDALLYPLQMLILLDQWDSAAYLIEQGANVHSIGGIKQIPFTRFRRSFNQHSSGPLIQDAELDALTHFNSVELLVRRGCNDGLKVLKQMISKGGVAWHGANEFHVAIEGANPLYVSEVLKHCAPLITAEDLTWINYCKSDLLNTVKVPSLLWLFNSVLKKQNKVDIQVLARLVKEMVSLGYDCNLTCQDPATSQEIGIEDPLLFFVLDIDFKHETTLVLKSLLRADQLQLNVRNSAGRNAIEHVINLWHENCMKDNRKCWKNPEKNYCLQTITLLVNHGVNVSEMTLGEDFKYHYGYKPIVQMLYFAGAKIDSKFFDSPVCHEGYLGTRAFPQEIDELNKWVGKFDEEIKLSLGNMCRWEVRKSLQTIADLRRLDILPERVKKELQIQTRPDT